MARPRRNEITRTWKVTEPELPYGRSLSGAGASAEQTLNGQRTTVQLLAVVLVSWFRGAA